MMCYMMWDCDIFYKNVDIDVHGKVEKGAANGSATVALEICVGNETRLRPMQGLYTHGVNGLPPRAPITKSSNKYFGARLAVGHPLQC